MSTDEIKFPKSRKLVFVIMPFSRSPGRDSVELDEFFEEQIKKSIETNASFAHSYEVRRSGVDLDITGQIVRDLYGADLVICDLSGEFSNPNVMFELGVRLTCSDKPVILIREDHHDNRSIFDIQVLHTFSYNPKAYARLRGYIEEKIKRFESGAERYRSPVLEILGDEARVHRIDRLRAANLLSVLRVGFFSYLRVISTLLNDHLAPHGLQLAADVFLLSSEIDRLYSELQKIDWSGIRLAIGPHPALGYYLATRYLDGLIDKDLELDLSVMIASFYERHFVNMMSLIDFDLLRIKKFAYEAALLNVVCDDAREVLNTEEGTAEHSESIARLRDLIDRVKSLMP